jgi:hypothetical protein
MQFEPNLEVLMAESIRQVDERKRLNVNLNGGNHAGTSVLTTLAPAAEPALSVPQHINNKGNNSTAAPDVYRAICQVAKAISRDGIAKGRRNESQGYGFRGIDDVYNALSALLAGADLCILPRMLSRTQEERATAKGGVLFYVTVQADFDFVSVRDGSIHTVTMYGEAMDSSDKATNKAMSAAYKYCAMQVFCIPTEGMADADSTTPQPEPKIDTGGHPVNTQAAADHVAQQKIAAGQAKQPTPKQPAPWTNRGEMKRAFARIRERVGEVAYLDALGRYHCTTDLNWREASKALECYELLLEKAVA